MASFTKEGEPPWYELLLMMATNPMNEWLRELARASCPKPKIKEAKAHIFSTLQDVLDLQMISMGSFSTDMAYLFAMMRLTFATLSQVTFMWKPPWFFMLFITDMLGFSKDLPSFTTIMVTTNTGEKDHELASSPELLITSMFSLPREEKPPWSTTLLAINLFNSYLPSFTAATIVSQCLCVLTLMSLHLLTDLTLNPKVRLMYC
jgi:hypothetical protein